MSRPRARFDDAVSGTALCFPPGGEVLAAVRHDEVAPVLRAVEERTARGEWAYGFVSYEAAPAFAPELQTRPAMDDLPLAWFVVTGAPVTGPVATAGGSHHLGPWTGEWDADDHRRRVERVRAHIGAGDTYQVNLTTRLTAPASGDMLGLHADLVARQGGAHHAYLDTGRFAVVSASPELFFSLRGDEVVMRPMKGTAARGATPTEDRRLADRLVRSEKERAENIMIVDLVRNDLARLATVGSVRVTDLLHLERYRTVHQLTSRVTATRRPGTTLPDVFAALFPCGSVTGAPKARTMELITALESSPRGVYCGAIGVVAPPDAPFRARFNVAIRTVVVDRTTGRATYGTGGGITWSSDPAEEYRELLLKASILDPAHSRADPPSKAG